MKRLLLIVALLAAARAHAAVPDERCSARADITSLPVVTLSANVPSDRFAVMITGDGGWRRIDQKITDRLRAAGIPIVRFVASHFLTLPPSPVQPLLRPEPVPPAPSTHASPPLRPPRFHSDPSAFLPHLPPNGLS